MQFRNGSWLDQKGYQISYAAQPYEVEVSKHAVKVLATSAVIVNRGQTLQGPNLEITYSSSAEDVVKVHIDHFKGALNNSPEFELNEEQGYTPEIVNNDEYAELVSGSTRVVIHKGDKWNVEFFSGKNRLTGTGWRSTAYVEESRHIGKAREALHADDYFFDYPAQRGGSYLTESLDLSVGECVYGFGEKFTNFVKNGQVVETWNSDGGTSTSQAYKNIPFYLSSNGYGVLVNTSDKVSFEVGSDTVSRVSFTLPGESLEYFVIGGEDLKQVLSNYTTLTGKPALPPAYSFGLWLSTSFTTNYNEETVNSFVDGMEERGIPLQVFHFDCFWMKEHEWCNMKWDTRQFPDPEGMLSRLREKGLEICVWINPYVGQRSELFEIGVKEGYFLKNTDGSVFQTDLWQPGLAVIDFTNPAACEWYTGLLKELFKMGVNNLKTDFGERIPTNVVYHNGKDPVKMHNYYTYLYNKVVFRALEDYYGKDKACLFSRSATVGGQQFPVHWGGDCYAEYPAMAETLRAGLSLCSSGFGYFSHDIGGFEATATPDVYKRWCAFGLMSTHSRLHGSSSYRVPWLFDEEASDVLKFYTRLKGRLMPYLFAQAVKTHRTGVPMMRSMVVEFMEDPACKYLDNQYMLGDNLLVAPVMNEAGTAEFYLPDGTWTDIVTGDTYQGGRYYRRQCSYTEMPVLARGSSIIAYGQFDRDCVYDYLEGTDFVLYSLEDGGSAETVVFDSEAKQSFSLRAVRSGSKITVTHTETQHTFTVSVAGTKTSVVSGGKGAVSLEISL